MAEEALSSGSWVWFTVVRCLDRGHRLCKVLAHLDMLVKHMIPRHVVHLDEMALGVVNLGDDMRSVIRQGYEHLRTKVRESGQQSAALWAKMTTKRYSRLVKLDAKQKRIQENP